MQPPTRTGIKRAAALTALALLLAATTLLAGCDDATTTTVSGTTGSADKTTYGSIDVADFTALDLEGNPVTADVFAQRKLTFINYWATWCGPCRNELPDFQALYDKYGNDITFLTIVEDGADNATAVSACAQYLPFATNVQPPLYPIEALNSGYVPTSIIVDAQGNILTEVMIGALGPGYSTYFDQALAAVG
jgi:thiol-disulfide isomerase/thioredoxin